MGRVDLPPKRDRLGTATRIPDLGGDWAECARGVRRVKIVQADLLERPWTRALVARAVPNVSTGQDRRVPGKPAEPKVFRPTDASTAADESLCGVRVFAFHVTAQGSSGEKGNGPACGRPTVKTAIWLILPVAYARLKD